MSGCPLSYRFYGSAINEPWNSLSFLISSWCQDLNCDLYFQSMTGKCLKNFERPEKNMLKGHKSTRFWPSVVSIFLFCVMVSHMAWWCDYRTASVWKNLSEFWWPRDLLTSKKSVTKKDWGASMTLASFHLAKNDCRFSAAAGLNWPEIISICGPQQRQIIVHKFLP